MATILDGDCCYDNSGAFQQPIHVFTLNGAQRCGFEIALEQDLNANARHQAFGVRVGGVTIIDSSDPAVSCVCDPVVLCVVVTSCVFLVIVKRSEGVVPRFQRRGDKRRLNPWCRGIHLRGIIQSLVWKRWHSWHCWPRRKPHPTSFLELEEESRRCMRKTFRGKITMRSQSIVSCESE
jgi:hypothetical protein